MAQAASHAVTYRGLLCIVHDPRWNGSPQFSSHAQGIRDEIISNIMRCVHVHVHPNWIQGKGKEKKQIPIRILTEFWIEKWGQRKRMSYSPSFKGQENNNWMLFVAIFWLDWRVFFLTPFTKAKTNDDRDRPHLIISTRTGNKLVVFPSSIHPPPPRRSVECVA